MSLNFFKNFAFNVMTTDAVVHKKPPFYLLPKFYCAVVDSKNR